MIGDTPTRAGLGVIVLMTILALAVAMADEASAADAVAEGVAAPTSSDAFAVLSRQVADIRKKEIPEEQSRLYCPFYNYKTAPHAIVAGGVVYCVFQNSSGRPHAMMYDINDASWRGPIQISQAGLGKKDKHGVPSLCIDGEGFLHVFFGCHSRSVGAMLHSRSVRPYDITEWNKQKMMVGDATYPGLIKLKDGKTCLLYRRGNHLNPWVMQVSSDNCKTWTSPQPIVNMRLNHADRGLCSYCRFFPGSDGKTIHCFWNLKDDTPTPPTKYAGLNEAVYRYHIYYMCRDADGTWRNAAGEEVTVPVNVVQARAKCLVYDSGDQFTLMQYGCRLGVDERNRPYIKFRTGVVDWMRVRNHDIEEPIVVIEPLRWKFASFESGRWRVTDELPNDWPGDAASLISARGTLAAGSDADDRWFIFWPMRPLTDDKGAYIFLYNERSGYARREGGPADVQ